MLKFIEFLKKVEQTDFQTNTTITGTSTIQQSARNSLRQEGVAALLSDLQNLYGTDFDVVETKEGIVIVAENVPGDFTFSWELKNTIKSLDYDPFIEANNFEEERLEKATKKARLEAEKVKRQEEIAAKRRAIEASKDDGLAR